MKRIKIIIICLLVPFFILSTYTFFKIKNKEESRQKDVLAVEMRKVLEYMLFDLHDARENAILDVPADGVWHDRITFERGDLGTWEYLIKARRLLRINNGKILMIADNMVDMHIRRQKETPDILEVQIEAKKKVSLKSNLRIRIHQ